MQRLAASANLQQDPTLPAAVQAQGVSRRFNRHYALRDITFTVAPGTVLLVVGPNGAGKTTLLRVLATALRPSAGRVTVFGSDLVGAPDAVRRMTAYVGATGGMYEALTAEENLVFAAAMSGRPMRPDLLDRVGLAEAARAPVRTFSQGMRRRLALARAWLLAPRLLLLDDPFGSLDQEGSLLVHGLVADVKTAGGSVVLATHEWERGLRSADAVLALARGRQVVEADGGPVLLPPRPTPAGERA